MQMQPKKREVAPASCLSIKVTEAGLVKVKERKTGVFVFIFI
jgi:hypothetical protein